MRPTSATARATSSTTFCAETDLLDGDEAARLLERPGRERVVPAQPRALVERDRRRVITFFTIPKPFEGHIGTIQRNALASWTQGRLRRAGARARRRGGRGRRGGGDRRRVRPGASPQRVRHAAARRRVRIAAERRPATTLLCFVNADILLPPSLRAAVARAARLERPFPHRRRVLERPDRRAARSRRGRLGRALLRGAPEARRRRGRLLRLHARDLRRHPAVRRRTARLRQLADLEGACDEGALSSTQRGP